MALSSVWGKTLRALVVAGWVGTTVPMVAQDDGLKDKPKVIPQTTVAAKDTAAKAPPMLEPPDPGPVKVGDKGMAASVAHVGRLGEIDLGKAEPGLKPDKLGRASALAHYSAALQAEVKGDMKAAFEHYREVMRGDVAEAELVRRATALAVRYGSEAEAEALLVERMKATPDRPGPTLRLVEFLDAYQATEASSQRADALMIEVMQRFPQDTEVAISGVLRHLVKGRRDQAIQLLKASTDKPGGDAAYWLALANVAQEVWPLGQTELAEEHRQEVNVFYERALAAALKVKDRARELEVAQYYVLSNQLGLAKKVCEGMAARDGDLTARKILYRLYESEDLQEKAFALLEGIVRDDPKDVTQRRLLAEVLEKRQQFPEAARHLEAAIQVGAGTASDYEKLTNLWLGLQQPDKAITLVTRAIRLFPDTPGFLAQAAMAYAAKQDLPRAIESFAEAERLGAAGGMQSFNHRFYFRFGVVLEQAERYEEAAEQLQRSIEMTPEAESDYQANTLNYLGYMWVELGQKLDEAEKLIQQAVKLEPDNAAFIDSLGWLLHKQGKHAEALVELKRAEGLLKELEPGDAEILEHIAAVQEALGQKAEALATLQRAAALQTPDETVAKRILDGLKRLGGGK
jgi:tetratricopeptide (TPR) repeat protein